MELVCKDGRPGDRQQETGLERQDPRGRGPSPSLHELYQHWCSQNRHLMFSFSPLLHLDVSLGSSSSAIRWAITEVCIIRNLCHCN